MSLFFLKYEKHINTRQEERVPAEMWESQREVGGRLKLRDGSLFLSGFLCQSVSVSKNSFSLPQCADRETKQSDPHGEILRVLFLEEWLVCGALYCSVERALQYKHHLAGQS